MHNMSTNIVYAKIKAQFIFNEYCVFIYVQHNRRYIFLLVKCTRCVKQRASWKAKPILMDSRLRLKKWEALPQVFLRAGMPKRIEHLFRAGDWPMNCWVNFHLFFTFAFRNLVEYLCYFNFFVYIPKHIKCFIYYNTRENLY